MIQEVIDLALDCGFSHHREMFPNRREELTIGALSVSLPPYSDGRAIICNILDKDGWWRVIGWEDLIEFIQSIKEDK